MNADKINMVAGSVIAALLVFLLLNFFGKQIFHSGGHHGHDEEALAFAVETGDEAAPAGEDADADGGFDYAALVANADLAAGEKQFRKCRACHKIADGENGVGPHLWRVLGRPIASVEGFGYSPVLSGKGGEWGLENLSAFIENPRAWAPGTKMSYAGMKKPADRVNLIAWMNEAGGAPIRLAEAPAPAAETVETAEAETAEAETETETSTDSPAPSSTASGAYADLLANADPRKGRRAFRKCRACHKLEEGENSIGPSLYGVIHRDVASVDGFDYSAAMTAKEGKWTLDELMNFIQAPQSWVPGTKMTFAGLRDEQDRIDVIVFLNEADGSPEVLE